MDKVGIFFGTDTGTTRLIAKKMAKKLGDVASKPLNVNRISVDAMLAYEALILGTPSYGEGDLPGVDTGVKNGSWQEFIAQLDGVDMTGKTVALYGLGDQEKYPDRFASSLYQLYKVFTGCGANLVGDWDVSNYVFDHSDAVVDGRFVGLVIDNHNQGLLTDERIANWLDQVKPKLLGSLG